MEEEVVEEVKAEEEEEVEEVIEEVKAEEARSGGGY